MMEKNQLFNTFFLICVILACIVLIAMIVLLSLFEVSAKTKACQDAGYESMSSGGPFKDDVCIKDGEAIYVKFDCGIGLNSPCNLIKIGGENG